MIIKKVSQPVDAHKRRNFNIFLRLDFPPTIFFLFGQHFTLCKRTSAEAFIHSICLPSGGFVGIPSGVTSSHFPFSSAIVTLTFALITHLRLLYPLFPLERTQHLRIRDAAQVRLQAPVALLRRAPRVLQTGASGTAAQLAVACHRSVPAGIALQAQVSVLKKN